MQGAASCKLPLPSWTPFLEVGAMNKPAYAGSSFLASALIALQGARAWRCALLTFMSQAGALQGLGGVPRTADRRASDAEAKALRLQRWKERNAGSSLVATGSGSADGKSQPAPSVGTRRGRSGHRSRSKSKSPSARQRRSSQEDGELAGTLLCWVLGTLHG